MYGFTPKPHRPIPGIYSALAKNLAKKKGSEGIRLEGIRGEAQPVSYNQFTAVQLKTQFGLQIVEEADLFADVPPVEISRRLRENLAADTRLALRSGSEKARSEYIIAPILAEVYQQTQDHANLFSGVEFDVDVSRGLTGYCDFLFSLSALTIEIEAPVVSVVEAKRENILRGIPQCLAELLAAQIFNAQAGRPVSPLYGVVTTGEIWQFLRLQDTVATIDQTEYHFSKLEHIVGILVWMLRSV